MGNLGASAESMGSSDSKEVEVSARQKKLNEDLVRVLYNRRKDKEAEKQRKRIAAENARKRPFQQKAAKVDVHQAARTGNLAELNLVAEFAPDRINEELHGKYESNGDYEGYSMGTPLHFAAQEGQEAAISLLLSAKANVNETNNRGNTPLHSAAGYILEEDEPRDNEAVVSLLLSAKADVNAIDHYGCTPHLKLMMDRDHGRSMAARRVMGLLLDARDNY